MSKDYRFAKGMHTCRFFRQGVLAFLLLFFACSASAQTARPLKKPAIVQKKQGEKQKPSRFRPEIYWFGAASYNQWFDVHLLYDKARIGLRYEHPRVWGSAYFLQEGELYFNERIEIERDTEISRFVDTLYQGGEGSLSARPFKNRDFSLSVVDRAIHENATDNRYDNAHNTLSALARLRGGRVREVGSEYHWHYRRYFSFERLDLDGHTGGLYYQDDFGLKLWYTRLTALGSYRRFPNFIVRNEAGGASGSRREDYIVSGLFNTWWLFGEGWTATADYRYERNFSNGAEFDTAENRFLPNFYDYELHLVAHSLAKRLGDHEVRYSGEYENRHFMSRPARTRDGRIKQEDRMDNNVKLSLEAILQAFYWWQFNFNYTVKLETSTEQNVSFKRNFLTHIGTVATTIHFR